MQVSYESAMAQCLRKHHLSKRGAKLAARTVRAFDRSREIHVYRCPWCGDGWLLGGTPKGSGR